MPSVFNYFQSTIDVKTKQHPSYVKEASIRPFMKDVGHTHGVPSTKAYISCVGYRVRKKFGGN